MKLVFVYWGFENAGSMLDLKGYARAAEAAGHQVTVYGPPGHVYALDYSKDLAGADAVVFVVEWTTQLQFGDRLDWVRLLSAVPRNRRVVIDCDGAYNDPISFRGDYNHKTAESSRAWIAFCDSLSDKICQPTPTPLRPNVRPFLFHIYDPDWETPLDFSAKEFGMIYVGHTKFRWHGMSQVLRGIEPIRGKLGRIGLVGEGWDAPLEWTQWKEIRDDYFVDRDVSQADRRRGAAGGTLQGRHRDDEPGDLQSRHLSAAVRAAGLRHLPDLRDAGLGHHPAVPAGRGLCPQHLWRRGRANWSSANVRTRRSTTSSAARNHYGDIVLAIRDEFRQRHSPEARLRDLIGIIEQ